MPNCKLNNTLHLPPRIINIALQNPGCVKGAPYESQFILLNPLDVLVLVSFLSLSSNVAT
jgi:hypothetical protein